MTHENYNKNYNYINDKWITVTQLPFTGLPNNYNKDYNRW